MRFLSTKRHSRAAKPVLLLLALVLVGCVYAFVSPSASGRADTNASTQVARGKEIFQQNCSSCHGLNGEGTTQGPSLAGVGADGYWPYADGAPRGPGPIKEDEVH